MNQRTTQAATPATAYQNGSYLLDAFGLLFVPLAQPQAEATPSGPPLDAADVAEWVAEVCQDATLPGAFAVSAAGGRVEIRDDHGQLFEVTVTRRGAR